MKRVLGIGGIFFKAQDPKKLAEWYRTHLGIDVQPWGGAAFQNTDGTMAVWSIFPSTTEYLNPSTAPFMINYRVDDVHALVAALRAEGCIVDDKVDESEFGKFGWVMDPEGNRIELWEPPATAG